MLFKIYFYNLLLFQIVSNCDIVLYALNKQKNFNANIKIIIKIANLYLLFKANDDKIGYQIILYVKKSFVNLAFFVE